MLQKLILVAALGVAGCSAQPDRLAFTPAASTLQLQPLVSSAMVRTVSLPTYAAVEEIPLQEAGGLITADGDILWADDPQRAITLAISTTLAQITGADVGAEPWPFIGLPDVAIDIRVTQMIAGSDGTFQLAGQYFVGGDGIDFRNTARTFDIRQPMADQNLGSISAAQSAAILTLTEQIARSIAR
ncbi:MULTISPECIES: PqiC family protein [unclassified Yoonia]|uniref:PqiC family protein n=1 Tax=unclassified Yoonia TaxID=2629118 RepID=UPI002AFF819A|nr:MULTISPECIES: ABC-type transport auxiliary lipoprotein family protein [unclassified Yoonia]